MAGSFSNHILNPKTDQSRELSPMKMLTQFMAKAGAQLNKEEDLKNLCPCCDRKDPEGNLGMAPLSRSCYNFVKIGFAVPLYFDFAKLLMFIGVGMFVLMGIYQIIIYGSSDECRYTIENSNQCGSKWLFVLSRANTEFSIVYSVTNHLLFVISVIFLYAIRFYYSYRFTKKTVSADQRFIDITDYTIKVTNLPLDCTKQEVVEFFSQFSMRREDGSDVKLQVAAVNFVYHNYKELTEADNELTKTLKQYREEFLGHDKAKLQVLRTQFDHLRRKTIDLVVERFTQQGDIIEGLLKKKHKQILEFARKNQNFSGVAYISLETEEMAGYVEANLKISNIPKWALKNLGYVPLWMYQLPGGKRHLFRSGMYVHIDKAQPPQDVIWENMGPQSMSPLVRKGINILASLIIMAFCFLIFWWLKTVQQNTRGNFWMSLLFTLIIKALNKLVVATYKLLVKLEKIDSLTLEYVASTSRLAIITFTNSVIMLIVLNLIVAGSVSELRSQLLGDSGLAKDLFFMLLFSFVDLIGAFVNFGMFLKLWKRRQMVRMEALCPIDQQQANELFEGFDFIFSDRLTKYCKVVMLLFFIVHFFPITPVLALVYLPVYYWADKYFLLRLATIPKFCTDQLGHSMLRFLDFAFIIYTVGFRTHQVRSSSDRIFSLKLYILGHSNDVCCLYTDLPLQSRVFHKQICA
jgi:Cytosolic domain of 10TM putative phosphate transporter